MTARPSPAPEAAAPESELPPEDPPPPTIYVQASDAQLPNLKPSLPIHVVKPWDAIPYRRIGGSRFTAPSSDGAWWELQAIDEQNDRGYFRGDIDGYGFGEMSLEALSRWIDGGYRLHINAEGFREVVMDGPPQPLGETLTVSLEPAGLVAHYRGRVLDDRGRPLAGAGVFAIAPEGPGARTDKEGRFDLALALDEEPGDEPRLLSAVAPGFLSATVRGQTRGEDGIEFSLTPDQIHGHLALRLLQADGSPAARARAWIYPEGRSWQRSLGWASWFGDDAPEVDESGVVEDEQTTTRRLLARLVGGQAADDQGYEIAQDAGPLLNDLVAGEDGRILIPAIKPGTYHLRAALARPIGGTYVFNPPECDSFNVQQTLDTTITVEPPPGPTNLELRLQTGRTITGRIEVAENLTWHCDHREHRHFMRVEDWVWTQVVVRSGVSDQDERTLLSGRFRFDGLPRTACAIRVWTSYHPDVVIELPVVPEGAVTPFDLGTIRVPAARSMDVRLIAEDGAELDAWDGSVEVRGVLDAQPQRWDGPKATVMLPTPPGADASIVVLPKGKTEAVTVVRAPFDFTRGKPILITVPNPKHEGDAGR